MIAVGAMTLHEAIAEARTIQTDLDAGRLSVPYPPDVRKRIMRCLAVMIRAATDTASAREIVQRLNAPERETAELPW